MSLLKVQENLDAQLNDKTAPTKLTPEQIFSVYKISDYKPTDDENTVRKMIVKHFQLGDLTMNKPRVEFNDMSVLGRMTYDQMAFNTYQPNNGNGLDGDILNSWKANVIKPVVRNKCISIYAHITANLIFPKVFAYDESNDEQKDAATVMSDLMEWAADRSDFSHVSFQRILSAITDPASIGYTEYVETYRTIKKEKKGKKWTTEEVLDETLSGFKDYCVPCNELYIENPFEPDIQKQGWLIWRRVISYSLAEAKYNNKYDNFKHVFPGVQLIYNDANNAFYQVYDSNLRQDEVEEIIYWNRTLDLRIVMVNGVMLTDYDEPNPRIDKKYPFDKFYYETINPKFFYGKSVAAKMQQDATIISDLYNMIIDGTFLSIMPPMINAGGEAITSDVIIPGAVTTLEDPNASIKPIAVTNNLSTGLNVLHTVEESLADSSEQPLNYGIKMSAYAMSRQEQQAAISQGPFMKQIAQHVKDFGKLRISDIIQYMTIADVDKLEENGEMVYKTFLMGDKNTSGGSKTRKIQFDDTLKSQMTDDEMEQESFNTKAMEDKYDNTEIYRVNPELFRTLTFTLSITPDVLNPRSADLEKQMNLEAYDRMIQNPLADPEETFRFLLQNYDGLKKDPDKFVAKQNPEAQVPSLPGLPPQINTQAGIQGGQPATAMTAAMPGAPKAAPHSPMPTSSARLPQSFAQPKVS